MPEYYMELPIDDNESIRVEVTSQAVGLVRASRLGDTIDRTSERLDEAVTQLAKIGEQAVERVRNLAEPPTTIQLELGLKLSIKSGFVLAESTGEAHVVVKLEWARGPGSTPGFSGG